MARRKRPSSKVTVRSLETGEVLKTYTPRPDGKKRARARKKDRELARTLQRQWLLNREWAERAERDA